MTSFKWFNNISWTHIRTHICTHTHTHTHTTDDTHTGIILPKVIQFAFAFYVPMQLFLKPVWHPHVLSWSLNGCITPGQADSQQGIVTWLASETGALMYLHFVTCVPQTDCHLIFWYGTPTTIPIEVLIVLNSQWKTRAGTNIIFWQTNILTKTNEYLNILQYKNLYYKAVIMVYYDIRRILIRT